MKIAELIEALIEAKIDEALFDPDSKQSRKIREELDRELNLLEAVRRQVRDAVLK